jgi:hypothetical protein
VTVPSATPPNGLTDSDGVLLAVREESEVHVHLGALVVVVGHLESNATEQYNATPSTQRRNNNTKPMHGQYTQTSKVVNTVEAVPQPTWVGSNPSMPSMGMKPAGKRTMRREEG